jgi:hypothetical protein
VRGLAGEFCGDRDIDFRSGILNTPYKRNERI